jgi:Uma2 family endonuclease
MAEPARRTPDHDEPEIPSEEKLWDVVQRWVSAPGGGMELQEFDLTPEYFLNPRDGDKVIQHPFHGEICHLVYGLLYDYFLPQEDVAVLFDVQILWGHRESRQPSPDVTVVRGVRDRRIKTPSFSVVREGVRPCLIIEVVSNSSEELRKTDLVDKVELYEQERIQEYLALDLPQPANGERFQWIGYRLGADGHYRPIEPDTQGRFLSETTGLLFGTSPDGQWIFVVDAATGERLLTASEYRVKALMEAERAEREAKKAQREAKKADKEAKARKAAEAEVARLRKELERLKSGLQD